MQRVVWVYWEQGAEHAPPMVQLCWESWRVRNPNWRIEFLDSATARDAVDWEGIDVDRLDMSVQKRSNLLRLFLLSQHGGVWADSTAFCLQPLDDWLPEAGASGFFAFRNPGPDRLFASWFLYGDPGNQLLDSYSRRLRDLFLENQFEHQRDPKTQELVATLNRYFSVSPEMTLFWTSPYALEGLKAYPYFIMHYVFNALILTDDIARTAWERVPDMPAAAPLAVGMMHSNGRTGGEAISRLTRDRPTMVKLNWRSNPTEPFWRDVLQFLRTGLAT